MSFHSNSDNSGWAAKYSPLYNGAAMNTAVGGYANTAVGAYAAIIPQKHATKNGRVSELEYLAKNLIKSNTKKTSSDENTKIINCVCKYNTKTKQVELIHILKSVNLLENKINNLELIDHAKNKDIENVEKLLIEFSNPNVIDPNGKPEHKKTALYYAIINKDIKMINLLLEYGADINSEDNDGINPLLLSVKNNDINLVKLLLINGANPNATIIGRENAFRIAIYSNADINIAKLLLKAGCNPYDKFHEWSPMECAIQSARYKYVKLLLDYDRNLHIYHEHMIFSGSCYKRDKEKTLNMLKNYDVYKENEKLIRLAHYYSPNSPLYKDYIGNDVFGIIVDFIWY